jgi:hypothetical protein
VKAITHSEEHKDLLKEILSRKIIIPFNLSWNGRAKCHKRKMFEMTEKGLKCRKISIDCHSTSQTETGTKMPNQMFSSKASSNSSFEVNYKIMNCGKSFSEPEIDQDHFKMDHFSVKNCSI